jgi:hypothetical protein
MEEESSDKELFYQLSYYTTSHKDPSFIHQYAVDAFAAQYADENTKPITITFALIGLYLHLEKNFSGKEVQNAHIRLGKRKKTWPKFNLPENRGNISIQDVLRVPEGLKRDMMIIRWCGSVWEAYSESHEKVFYLVKNELWSQ